MITHFKLSFIIALSIMLIACSSSQQSNSNGQLQEQGSNSYGAGLEIGKASYYADKYQSRQTANGERFDQAKKTAAHKTLAFGTWVKVTNVDTGKSVIVRINDRGPFVKGRIIDLSSSAFRAIGSTRLGILNVSVQVLK